MAKIDINVEAAEKAIEKLMAFRAFTDSLSFDRFGGLPDAEIQKLKARIDDLEETLIPASMVNMMLYYESKLTKAEIEATRYSIIKQAVRDVLAEEK